MRFRDDSEIIESLREYLPTWQLGGIAAAEVAQQATKTADERRWQAVKKEIDGLPDYNREGLRLLLDFPPLTDYTALQKLGQIACQHSLASILPGLQNVTGIVRIVPNQPATRRPEYELQFEITPELKPYVERYFRSIRS